MVAKSLQWLRKFLKSLHGWESFWALTSCLWQDQRGKIGNRKVFFFFYAKPAFKVGYQRKFNFDTFSGKIFSSFKSNRWNKIYTICFFSKLLKLQKQTHSDQNTKFLMRNSSGRNPLHDPFSSLKRKDWHRNIDLGRDWRLW